VTLLNGESERNKVRETDKQGRNIKCSGRSLVHSSTCRSIPYPVVQEVQEVRWYILHTCMCTQIPCVPVVDTPVTKKFPRSIKLLHIFKIKKFTLFILHTSVSGAHVCGTYTCTGTCFTCVLHIHIYR
jgi:hypothetical protein